MATADWLILIGFFAAAVAIGMWSARKSSDSAEDYFLSGRQMPWWLLGVSMVATTFSADTPNLVTNIVRQHGVAGNWMWWAFLLTGMLTVFVYARLWRRSGVMTDLAFYELRYGGRAAAFLRGFRAIYLGVFFNVIIMATVMLAGIKISGVLLGWSPLKTVLIAGGVTLVYSALGGLRGVLWTDFLMFGLAMTGAVAAAVFALRQPEVGGMEGLYRHFAGTQTLDLVPDLSDPSAYVPLLLIPLAVQWWSVWYPGAEPGGGGYIAQRMLAARDERHAMGAVLLFNVAHYVLRPWPWILVALASMIVFPDLASLQRAFPHVDPTVIHDDFAYPAMLSFLPAGWLGLAATSLIAAFMSTLSTHLNWGASYLVHDVYARYREPQASSRRQVQAGRIATVLLLALAIGFSLLLESALDAFSILLQIGAGTGLIYILRWFWWRINAWTEIAGMAASFLVAVFFTLVYPKLGVGPVLADYQVLLLSVGCTTVIWLGVTLLTGPESMEVLAAFYRKIRPASVGWAPVLRHGLATGLLQPTQVKTGHLPLQILAMLLCTIAVYGLLFATGYALYGRWSAMALPLLVALISGGVATPIVKRLLRGEG
jgi:SSS family solute:Na+ symporter